MGVGNVLVCEPAKAAEDKELPVVPPHADILDGLVDDLGPDCPAVSFTRCPPTITSSQVGETYARIR